MCLVWWIGGATVVSSSSGVVREIFGWLFSLSVSGNRFLGLGKVAVGLVAYGKWARSEDGDVGDGSSPNRLAIRRRLLLVLLLSMWLES